MIKDLSDNMVDSNAIKEDKHQDKKNLSASRASLLSTTFLLSFLAFSLKLATSLEMIIFTKSNVLVRIGILRIQLKLNTALLSHCPCVRSCVTGVTSHISHIYKGINAMLIIKPYIF